MSIPGGEDILNPSLDNIHVVEAEMEGNGLQNYEDENDINVIDESIMEDSVNVDRQTESRPRRTLSAGGRIPGSLPGSGRVSRGRSRERRKKDFVSDLGRKSGNLLRQMSRSKKDLGQAVRSEFRRFSRSGEEDEEGVKEKEGEEGVEDKINRIEGFMTLVNNKLNALLDPPPASNVTPRNISRERERERGDSRTRTHARTRSSTRNRVLANNTGGNAPIRPEVQDGYRYTPTAPLQPPAVHGTYNSFAPNRGKDPMGGVKASRVFLEGTLLSEDTEFDLPPMLHNTDNFVDNKLIIELKKLHIMGKFTAGSMDIITWIKIQNNYLRRYRLNYATYNSILLSQLGDKEKATLGLSNFDYLDMAPQEFLLELVEALGEYESKQSSIRKFWGATPTESMSLVDWYLNLEGLGDRAKVDDYDIWNKFLEDAPEKIRLRRDLKMHTDRTYGFPRGRNAKIFLKEMLGEDIIGMRVTVE